jgi:hypothetical protein
MSLKFKPVHPASNAVALTPNRAKRRREMIGHQIEITMRRHNTLHPDDPALRGLERTIERLNVEYQAED